MVRFWRAGLATFGEVPARRAAVPRRWVRTGPGFPSIWRNQLVVCHLARPSRCFLPALRAGRTRRALVQVDRGQPSFRNQGMHFPVPLNIRTGSNPQGVGTRPSGTVRKPGTIRRLVEAACLQMSSRVASNGGEPTGHTRLANSNGAYRRLYQGSMLLFPVRANAHSDRRRSPVWSENARAGGEVNASFGGMSANWVELGRGEGRGVRRRVLCGRAPSPDSRGRRGERVLVIVARG